MSTQAQFNDYKYVVVPIKFDAFKNQNQYRTSTLIKYQLINKGFNVVYSDNLPFDLEQQKCLGLYVNLIDNSALFSTKTFLVFKNCYGEEVYRTREGISKEKEYELAYNESIEEAIYSMGSIAYNYQGKSEDPGTAGEQSVTVNFSNDVKKLEKSKLPKKSDGVVIKNETTVADQTYKTVEIEKPTTIPSKEKDSGGQEFALYAQPTKNGYQLVDTIPKVVYVLTSTTVPDIFLVEGDNIDSGLVFKKEGKWFLEYSNESGKSIKELNIKF